MEYKYWYYITIVIIRITAREYWFDSMNPMFVGWNNISNTNNNAINGPPSERQRRPILPRTEPTPPKKLIISPLISLVDYILLVILFYNQSILSQIFWIFIITKTLFYHWVEQQICEISKVFCAISVKDCVETTNIVNFDEQDQRFIGAVLNR